MQIQGRTFILCEETTLQQDAFIMKRLRASKMADATQTFDPATEDLSDAAERTLLAAMENGVIFEVMGGALVEPGVVWTPEIAIENATLFSSITSKEDKAAMYEQIGIIMADFLVSVAKSNPIIPKSSAAPVRDGPVPQRTRKTSPGRGARIVVRDDTTTASGMDSSAS